jgi:predicted exporter
MQTLRFRALLWLLLASAIAVACGHYLTRGNVLQTNLLALLPPTERNPLAEEAITHLAEAGGNRVVILIGHSTPGLAKAGAAGFAESLRKTAAFESVQGALPPLDVSQLGAFYLEHRFNLLSDADRAALSKGGVDLEERLQRKLYAPFRFGVATPFSLDPFGFTENWLDSLPLHGLKLEQEGGWLRTRPDAKETRTYFVVTATLRGSSYDGDLQSEAVKAIQEREAELRSRDTGFDILHTGTLFYAHAARERAELEVDLIGLCSAAGILLMMYWVFRSPRPLILGALSVAFGIGAAMVAVIFLNGQLHLVTLVFGASLIGEAIDYSIQYFAAHLGAGENWDPLRGLHAVLPGLSIALGTSLLGYGALSFAPFPALKQIALFAFVGLGAAYISVVLLLPALMREPNRRDAVAATAAAERILAAWKARMNPRRCALLLAACAAIALPGWLMLEADDDIRVLINRPGQLVQQEERIRALTGFDSATQFLLVEGADAEDVLKKEEALRPRLDALREDGALSGYRAVSAFVPSSARQAENRALLEKALFADPLRLSALFERAGLREDFATQTHAHFIFTREHRLQPEEWLGVPLSAPFRTLWLGPREGSHASIVLPEGLRRPEALAALNLPGITWVDKPGSISELFQRYRAGGAMWLCAALALVLVLLSLRYGLWRAAMLTLPALLGIALALAFFGYAGIAVNLFNLMALMLVLGVGVNYAIFLIEGRGRESATFAGVLLSACTTLLSFGLLAFSAMPALSGFGLTLLIGIGVAVLLSPIVSTLAPREPNT